MSEAVLKIGDVRWVGIAPPKIRPAKLQDALAAVFPDVGGWMNKFCDPAFACERCKGHGEIMSGRFDGGHTHCRACRGTGWRNGFYPA